jgi:N6-L-threonylcarbamoyladenine synthase
MLVLGIETSCDETAAAVVRDGRDIVSSIIYSQIATHQKFGGVVPELASREHLERISSVVGEALVGTPIEALHGVTVTQGPGLIGSLLVGVSYAKAFAYACGIPVIGINHIEGHFYSVVFENPPIEYPAMALIVSGGHTNLFFVPEEGSYRVVSRTRDDAAGEAFDKVSKMLGLGYPGGPAIERIAAEGDTTRFRFTMPKISDGRPDFSFSGMKTAVSKFIREHDISSMENGGEPPAVIKDLAAGFQEAVVRSLANTLYIQARELKPRTLIIAGGVACNQALREAVSEAGRKLDVPAYFPSHHLSTDNAAMIAAAGHAKLKRGESSDLSLAADVTLRLQNIQNEEAELRRRKVRYKL